MKADGRLSYRDFMLPNPDRLVVDFADVTARASVRSIDVGENPVRKVRLGQFSAESPKVARLVLDLSGRAPYRIIDGADGVRIVFGENGEPAAADPRAPRGHAGGGAGAGRAGADPGARGDGTTRRRRAPGPAAPARAPGARARSGALDGSGPGERRARPAA